MTTQDFNSNDEEVDNNPLFKNFKWHRKEVDDVDVPGRNLTSLAGQVVDISSGCEIILEMIEFDYLQIIGGQQRLMGDCEMGNLTRLAIQSLRLLNQQADESMTWAYNHCTEAGKASKSFKGEQS